MTSRMQKAQAAWGHVPEWVAAIVDECDMPSASQNTVSRKLGYSSAVISQVLANRYPGDLDRVEGIVRKNLMKAKVICPAIGEITEIACDQWRDVADNLTSSSPTRVRMFRACNSCPRFVGDDQ